MAAAEIRVPKLGVTEEDVVVADWLKAEGDPVAAGEVVVTIETDKATYEVTSPVAGVLARRSVEAGVSVAVGAVLGLVTPSQGPASVDQPLRASPLAKRTAQEAGVDLASVRGSGQGGAITKDDVLRAAAARVGERAQDTPTAAQDDLGALLPTTRVQSVTARRMTETFAGTPHFWLTLDCDAEAIRTVITALNDTPRGVGRVTVTDLIIASCAAAIATNPRINATWTSQGVRAFRSVNIGVATAIEDGLVVAVVRDVARRSIQEIASLRRTVVERARAGTATPEDLSGATFTVSNLGMYGIDQAAGILNPPGSAILFVGAIAKKAVVVEDRVVARERVALTLAGDHRVLDGVAGATFLTRLRDILEDPANALEARV